MIKHVVIFENSKVEFTDAAAAQNYKDNTPGALRIDVITESDPETPIENIEVPMWRLRAILTLMGLKDSVDAIINSLPEPDKSIGKIAWEYGNTIMRLSPITTAVQQGLSLTNTQVDEIFNQAFAINV